MLRHRQLVSLVGLSLVLWVAAALYIRLMPEALTSPLWGAVGFVTTFPLAWASVLLTRRVGSLTSGQFLAGVAIVGGIAMMIDGIALRWYPTVYGSDPTMYRFAAAWLLWGYGVSLGIAVIMDASQNQPQTR